MVRVIDQRRLSDSWANDTCIVSYPRNLFAKRDNFETFINDYDSVRSQYKDKLDHGEA